MFLPLFSNSESLCMDPVTAVIFGATVVISNATVTVINNTNSNINNGCRYFFPTPKDKEDAAIADAITAASKVDIAASQIEIEKSIKVLAFIEARKKFEKCAAESKPGSKKNNKGIPIECKELANIFAACGGIKEIAKIITDLENLGD